ncbi:MAG TPA: hypothetical protein VGC82_17920 [Rhodopila sp.]
MVGPKPGLAPSRGLALGWAAFGARAVKSRIACIDRSGMSDVHRLPLRPPHGLSHFAATPR